MPDTLIELGLEILGWIALYPGSLLAALIFERAIPDASARVIRDLDPGGG